MSLSEEVVDDYRRSLRDLNVNSKPLINMLTMLADDNAEQHACEIVTVIEDHILKCRPEKKLPALYLMDSIMKNLEKSGYRTMFCRNIVHVFTTVFEQVDEKTRASMYKLRQTWSNILPNQKLYMIDIKINKMLDPAWPVTAKPDKTNMHVNPKFLHGGESERSSPELQESMVEDDTESQEAQMRQQLIAKQQELLRVQQARLELELAEAAEKLKQTKQQITPTRARDLPLPSDENMLPLPEASPPPVEIRTKPVDPRLRDPRLRRADDATSTYSTITPNIVQQSPSISVSTSVPTTQIYSPYSTPQSSRPSVDDQGYRQLPWHAIAPPSDSAFRGEVYDIGAKFSDDNSSSDSSLSSFIDQSTETMGQPSFKQIREQLRDIQPSREQFSQEQRQREQSNRDQHSRGQSSRGQHSRGQSSRGHHSRGQSHREPYSREPHSREQSNSDQRYREHGRKRPNTDPRLQSSSSAKQNKPLSKITDPSVTKSSPPVSSSSAKTSANNRSNTAIDPSSKSKSDNKSSSLRSEPSSKIPAKSKSFPRDSESSRGGVRADNSGRRSLSKDRESHSSRSSSKDRTSKSSRPVESKSTVKHTDSRTDNRNSTGKPSRSKEATESASDESLRRTDKSKGTDRKFNKTGSTKVSGSLGKGLESDKPSSKVGQGRVTYSREKDQSKMEDSVKTKTSDKGRKSGTTSPTGRRKERLRIEGIADKELAEPVHTRSTRQGSSDKRAREESESIESGKKQRTEPVDSMEDFEDSAVHMETDSTIEHDKFDKDLSDLFGEEDEDYRSIQQLPLKSPSSKGWDQYKEGKDEYVYDQELKKQREEKPQRMDDDAEDIDFRVAVHTPVPRQTSTTSDVDIPTELSIEHHSDILLKAHKRLQDGLISKEDYQELMKQLGQLVQIHQLQQQEKRRVSIDSGHVPDSPSPHKEQAVEPPQSQQPRSPSQPLGHFRIPKKSQSADKVHQEEAEMDRTGDGHYDPSLSHSEEWKGQRSQGEDRYRGGDDWHGNPRSHPGRDNLDQPPRKTLLPDPVMDVKAKERTLLPDPVCEPMPLERTLRPDPRLDERTLLPDPVHDPRTLLPDPRPHDRTLLPDPVRESRTLLPDPIHEHREDRHGPPVGHFDEGPPDIRSPFDDGPDRRQQFDDAMGHPDFDRDGYSRHEEPRNRGPEYLENRRPDDWQKSSHHGRGRGRDGWSDRDQLQRQEFPPDGPGSSYRNGPPHRNGPLYGDGPPLRDAPPHRDGPLRDGPPLRDVAPYRGALPLRDGPTGRDGPFRDGPPHRDGQPIRDGPPLRDGPPPRDGPPHRDGPPLRDGLPFRDDPPHKDGPPYRDGPPHWDGPPLRDEPPHRDGPPRDGPPHHPDDRRPLDRWRPDERNPEKDWREQRHPGGNENRRNDDWPDRDQDRRNRNWEPMPGDSFEDERRHGREGKGGYNERMPDDPDFNNDRGSNRGRGYRNRRSPPPRQPFRRLQNEEIKEEGEPDPENIDQRTGLPPWNPVDDEPRGDKSTDFKGPGRYKDRRHDNQRMDCGSDDRDGDFRHEERRFNRRHGPHDGPDFPERIPKHFDRYVDKFNDPRFRCFSDHGPQADEEVVIGRKNFEVKLGAPPREIRWNKFGHIVVSADLEKRGVLLNGNLVYKFGERVKEITLYGRKEKIFYHGRPLSIWFDNQHYEIRLDSPPTSISINGKDHKIQVDGRDMMILIDKSEKGKYGGPARFIFVGEERVEVRFEPLPKTIQIDGNFCELNLDTSKQPPRVLINGVWHGIRFKGPPRDVCIDNRVYKIFPDYAVKIRVGPRFHYIALGGPCHELIIDGRCFEVKFNQPWKEITVSNNMMNVKLPGNSPEVMILPPLGPPVPPVGGPGVPGPISSMPQPNIGQPPAGLPTQPPAGLPLAGLPPMSQPPPLPLGAVTTSMLPPQMPNMMFPPPLVTQSGVGSIPPVLSGLFGKPPPVIPSAPAAPIDINSLLDKLVTSGIIKKETGDEAKPDISQLPVKPHTKVAAVKEVFAEIPDMTDLDPVIMKSLSVGAIQRLYAGLQCTSCGQRFNVDDEQKSKIYDNHLDWHFRQNKRDKDDMKIARGRKWFYGTDDWIQYEDVIEDEEEGKSNFFEQLQQESPESGDKRAQLSLTTAPDGSSITQCPEATGNDTDDLCNICHEAFEQYWDEELEEWHLREAIKVNNKTYHPICYEDYTEVSEGTPSPSILNSTQPSFTPRKSLAYEESSLDGQHTSFEDERVLPKVKSEPKDDVDQSHSVQDNDKLDIKPDENTEDKIDIKIKTEPDEIKDESMTEQVKDELKTEDIKDKTVEMNDDTKPDLNSDVDSEYKPSENTKNKASDIPVTVKIEPQSPGSVNPDPIPTDDAPTVSVPDATDDTNYHTGSYSEVVGFLGVGSRSSGIPGLDVSQSEDSVMSDAEADQNRKSETDTINETEPMDEADAETESTEAQRGPEDDSNTQVPPVVMDDSQSAASSNSVSSEMVTEHMEVGSKHEDIENEPTDSQEAVQSDENTKDETDGKTQRTMEQMPTNGENVYTTFRQGSPVRRPVLESYPGSLLPEEASLSLPSQSQLQLSPTSYSRLSQVNLAVKPEPPSITSDMLEIASNDSTPTRDELPSPDSVY